MTEENYWFNYKQRIIIIIITIISISVTIIIISIIFIVYSKYVEKNQYK